MSLAVFAHRTTVEYDCVSLPSFEEVLEAVRLPTSVSNGNFYSYSRIMNTTDHIGTTFDSAVI